MSDWLPGRLYRATVRGVPDVLVYRDEAFRVWLSLAKVQSHHAHPHAQVTEVRGPLYVLELDEQDARRVATDWAHPGYESTPTGRIGRQVAAQLPKPPRMAEPGWGASVVARIAGEKRRVRWLRYGAFWWSSEEYGTGFGWDDLIDPEPVGGES